MFMRYYMKLLAMQNKLRHEITKVKYISTPTPHPHPPYKHTLKHIDREVVIRMSSLF